MSRVLPLFKRQTKEVGELLPQLYLHGLALGDFELALRGLLGEGAPLSPASLLRLKAQWQREYTVWKQRRLDDLEVVYLWADELYVKAGLEDTKAALLVMIGVLSNDQKVVPGRCAARRIFPFLLACSSGARVVVELRDVSRIPRRPILYYYRGCVL